MKLAELGEFGLIERIRQADVTSVARVGIGDDCAAVEVPAGELLLTSSDLLLEGVHFRTDWTDYYSLGCKAVAVNVSDVAAMGGTPQAIFLGLAAPPDTPVLGLDKLFAGIREEAGRYGAELLGGDTCRSVGGLTLAITVQGHVPLKELVQRSGAQAGDRLWVSGSLGDSALALSCLQRGEQPSPEVAVRHHRPQARVALGRALAERGLVRAMIDISDGLLADLGHIRRASGVGAEIEVTHIPLSKAMRCHVAECPDALELVLRGGEDYELLFCVPPERGGEVGQLAEQLGVQLTEIGSMCSEPGLKVKGLESTGLVLGEVGYDHFSREP